MKRKMLLPLFAVVFAVLGAFASSPMVQMGWYDSNGTDPNGGVQDEISIPDDERTCSVEATSYVCKIVDFGFAHNAYDTKAHAEAGGGFGLEGLLKYD